MEHRARVVAVVPLFDPAPLAAEGIRATAAQVDAVVLVDDGSSSDVRTFVEGLGLPDAHLVVSSRNSGIAHALNRGVAIALQDLGADMVLTLDQDSVPESDYVENARAAITALTAADVRFTATAAGTVNGKQERGKDLPGLPYRTTLETIQSGLVFPAAVLRSLGGFDESLFIDCVDTDYILRGWGKGFMTVVVPDCRMKHALGDGIPVRLPVLSRRRDYVVPYHRPMRRYYITRNRVRLLVRHGRHVPGWAVRQTYEQAKYLVLDLVWGPEKGRQVLATALGAIDGARRGHGRARPMLARMLRGPVPVQARPPSDLRIPGR